MSSLLDNGVREWNLYLKGYKIPGIQDCPMNLQELLWSLDDCWTGLELKEK